MFNGLRKENWSHFTKRINAMKLIKPWEFKNLTKWWNLNLINVD